MSAKLEEIYGSARRTLEVEFRVTGAEDVELHGWTIAPNVLRIIYTQLNDEAIVANDILVSGGEVGTRGGILKDSMPVADIGAYYLTRDRLAARMAELKAPEWVHQAVEANWPDKI